MMAAITSVAIQVMELKRKLVETCCYCFNINRLGTVECSVASAGLIGHDYLPQVSN